MGGESWGISGPDFTVAYAVRLAVALGAFFLIRGLLLLVRSVTASGAAFTVGYLRGGRARLAATVLADLVALGALRVTRAGYLVVADDAAVGSGADRLLVHALELAGRVKRRRVDTSVRMMSKLGAVAEFRRFRFGHGGAGVYAPGASGGGGGGCGG